MTTGQTQFAGTSNRRDFLVELTKAVAGKRVSEADLPDIVRQAILHGLDIGALAERCDRDINTVMSWGDPEKPDKPDQESSLAIAQAILDQMMPVRQVADK
jgi:hypothetical protein